MRSRGRLIASGGVLLLAASGFIVGPTTAATVSGVENGKYSEHQAFAVQRSPAYPSCGSSSSYNSFTVTRNAGSASNPYSEATGGPVALGSNYLKIVQSGDSSAPWGIAMFNPSGVELRWDTTSSSWVTAPSGGFTTEKRFTETGQIYGASNEGFLHDSGSANYGTFFSPNSILESSRTYTPDQSLNDCVSSKAIAANLSNLQVSDDTIVPTTSTTAPETTTTDSSSTTTASPSSTDGPTTTAGGGSTTTLGGDTTTSSVEGDSGDYVDSADTGEEELSTSGFDPSLLLAAALTMMVTGLFTRRSRRVG